MKCVFVLGVLTSIVYIKIISRSINNVCKTFGDYYSDRDQNDNCYYNPDEFLSVPHIIVRNGYPLETHAVTTDDGYILTIFRIPYGKSSTSLKTRKPVFIQHGFGSNSAAFVHRRTKSLAFILADEGYDVWLGNSRGSIYSKNHTTLDDSNSEFWDFTVHEHGVFDLPAQMSYVQRVTQQKIMYVGYSMGTMAMYVYGVTYPDLSSKQVDFFINLAPVAYLNGTKSMLRFLFPYWLIAKPFVDFVTGGRFFVRFLSRDLLSVACYPLPIQLKICQIPEMILGGFSYHQNDPETLPISFLQVGDLISSKSLTHLIQIYLSGKFQNYDYGYEGNKRKYFQTEPPLYNLSNMKIPTYFIRAENDLVITKENVEYLYNSLPEKVRPDYIHVVDDEYFNHSDFVTANDVVDLLYRHIVKVLKDRQV